MVISTRLKYRRSDQNDVKRQASFKFSNTSKPQYSQFLEFPVLKLGPETHEFRSAEGERPFSNIGLSSELFRKQSFSFCASQFPTNIKIGLSAIRKALRVVFAIVSGWVFVPN